MAFFKRGFEEEESLSYQQITSGKTRKSAAIMLLEVLILSSQNMLTVAQQEPYADITIAPTEALLKEVVEVEV